MNGAFLERLSEYLNIRGLTCYAPRFNTSDPNYISVDLTISVLRVDALTKYEEVERDFIKHWPMALEEFRKTVFGETISERDARIGALVRKLVGELK